MPELPPLRFEPVFRRYLWGGRRLATVLGKSIGPEADYAESWEVVDRPEAQSVVAGGPLRGRTLRDLIVEFGGALLGRRIAENAAGARFPLLFKFLDAHQKLSVQVHPDDDAAARLSPPDLGKTEAWIVLHAEPGSVVYAGLKHGCDRATLEHELQRGAVESCLHRFEPRTGDCIFIPAGVVHALGTGLMIAEIQQSSDTTYRLYDWNRVGADGRPRPLHLGPALDTIDYAAGPLAPQIARPTSRPHVEQLVHCDKFVLDRWRFDSEQTLETGGRFHLLAVTRGEVRIEGDPAARPLRTGESLLLPASLSDVRLAADEPAELLAIYLP